jgi:hypothetical protein
MTSDGAVKVTLGVNHKLIKGVEYKIKNLQFKLTYSE